MIKVKTFFPNSQNPSHSERLDRAINDFLANNDITFVDIKYSTANNGSNSLYYSAMLVYETND